MVFLWIILGILALLFLITLIRVQVFATYNETLTLIVKVLFFKITLVSPDKKPKEKKEKKEKPKKKKKPEKEEKDKKEGEEKKDKKKKQSYLSKLKDKKGMTGLLSLLVSVAKIALGMLKGIFSHIVLKKFNVGITLSGEDASTVAVNYGKLCSIVYPAINVITSATVCKDYNVVLEPVFDPDKKTDCYADVHAWLRIIFVLTEAIKAGVKIIIARIRL